MKRFLSLSVLACAVSALLVSCEPMDVVDPFGIVHDDSSSSSSSSSSGQSSPSGRSSSQATSADLSGTWRGKSGSGQWGSVLRITQRGNSISGSMTWLHEIHNDTRSVSGTRSGNDVTLHIGGGDVWHLSVSGNSMKGSGDKYGTSRSYRLSFSR